jgi:hypothetical protein
MDVEILSMAGALRGSLNCTPGYLNRKGLQLDEVQSGLAT